MEIALSSRLSVELRCATAIDYNIPGNTVVGNMKEHTQIDYMRKNVAAALADREWTQSQLARRSGISRDRVCKFLNGFTPSHSVRGELILALSNALEIPLDSLAVSPKRFRIPREMNATG